MSEFSWRVKKKRSKISFLSRNLPSYFCKILKKNGFEYYRLNSSCIKKSADNIPNSSWLETSQHLDAQETVKKLSGSIYDWLIVDHYALDERWEKLVHPACSKLMVIDDLADLYHVCNNLVDQNYYKNKSFFFLYIYLKCWGLCTFYYHD